MVLHPADNERIELVVHLIIFKGGVALIVAEIVRNVDDETRVLPLSPLPFDGF